MSKKLGLIMIALLVVAFVMPSFAADVKIKGDFNNRFMVYTNHNDWLASEKGVIHNGTVAETWGEAKYRMWFDASTNDGKVKGVYAFEIGGLEYGKPGSTGKSVGGSYSGDAINIETRWLYTDFQLPWACEKARIRMGLQPFKVNSYLWSETIMGVTSDFVAGPVDFQLAWVRPYRDPVKDDDSDVEDLDSFYARVNFKPVDGVKAGVFGLYMTGDPDESNPANYMTITSQNYQIKKLANNTDLDLYVFGTDGKANLGTFFVRWDLMYEGGSIDGANFSERYNGVDYNKSVMNEDFDVSAWFAHVDLGMNIDKMQFTYTFWYASGDDDGSDSDFDGFIAIDIDRSDSICIMEGGFTDDDYFTEKDYMLDKGMIFNKLAFDFKADKKLKLGASLLYMMTAEDIEYIDNNGKKRKENSLGVELDAYLKYKLYDNLEFAVNAGYLFADDAMDFYEVDRDGSSDEDIFISTCRVRYKF